MGGDTNQQHELFIYSVPEMYLILKHFCQRFRSGDFSTRLQDFDLERNPSIYQQIVDPDTMLIINSIAAPGTPKSFGLAHPHKGFILFEDNGLVASAYVDYDMNFLRQRNQMPLYHIGIQDQEGQTVHLSFRPTKKSQDLASVLSNDEWPWKEEILQQSKTVTGIVSFISDLFEESGVCISTHPDTGQWRIFFSCYDPRNGRTTTIKSSDFFQNFQPPLDMNQEVIAHAIQQRISGLGA